MIIKNFELQFLAILSLSDDAISRIFRKSCSALRTDASETCAFLARKVNLGRFSRSLQASRKFLTCWWRG
ncbi:hypothetical protein AMECASPLE_008243 [Ameca splendens]|uniref:Uncharacterized protein n=1 Tax=Ameca splendens TaxID=208324 RepID=A0ABV0ZWV7_9TELE